MINKQILLGHLGNQPETIHFDNGNSITKFSIATTKKWLDKASNERKEATSWHNIIANGKLAEICAKWLKKGSQVYVEGETRHRSYESDGIKKYITEVYISEMKMLSKAEEPQGTALDNVGTRKKEQEEADSDNLPF